MADTSIGYNENEKCDDCGKPPVVIKHWGPITNGEFKSFCGKCWKKREEAYRGVAQSG